MFGQVELRGVREMPPERLELSTFRVKADCSSQLSYGGRYIVEASTPGS
jgi:hypothetical protein